MRFSFETQPIDAGARAVVFEQAMVFAWLALAAWAAAAPNVLTSEERAAGFGLLFNGQDLAGWDAPGGNWDVQDGALHRAARTGYLTYRGTVPDDFELRFEWKISAGGNSGIYYRPGQYEYQVLDNARHRDGKNPLTNAASIYGAVAPSRDATRPAGEWNEGRIVCRGTHIEHWLNGVQVVDLDYSRPEWKEAGERLQKMKTSFEARPSRVVLQDHGDPVWFRSIRLREL